MALRRVLRINVEKAGQDACVMLDDACQDERDEKRSNCGDEAVCYVDRSVGGWFIVRLVLCLRRR